MAHIHLRHAHPLDDAKARKAIDEIAKKLSEKLGVVTQWEGNALNFQRTGVQGKITMHPGELEIDAKLGMLFSAMKGTVESELKRILKDKF
ncbi:polyhydroxyalkanoic acid system family protein [Lysobacter soyae]|jgi:putative polyhydroxyalkanoate system protein|uniref:Polyhydroxyalkanoic acid system family protein n=1 Tax=Lysobacter soyae TaxID=2764185 RepID=A0ABX8WSK3_9GAMM|nr:polyhydroxyalkanoic acid system family protein [Lysobacter sp. CJ11]QYR53824.1 polyhydroxyalkanoic acid system family protein [Lysobacter sp. CJ11]